MHYNKLFGDLSKADVPDGAPGWLMPNFEAGADALC